MTQQLFSEEIRNARNEHFSNARVQPDAKGGTRKKTKPHLLVDFFATVWTGTTFRRKGEIQHCCYRRKDGSICGEVTIWKGFPTGHTGAHGKFGGSD